jgi:hypothetical protein
MILWANDLRYLFGGALIVNAVPHLVSALLGQPFRTPFSLTRGRPHSPPQLNILWGAFSLGLGYAVLMWAGHFDLGNLECAASFGLGGLLMGPHSARDRTKHKT